MSTQTILASVAVLTLTGCAQNWTKPGAANEGQYRLDAYACTRDAGIVGVTFGIPESEAQYRRCMEARGYVRRSS